MSRRERVCDVLHEGRKTRRLRQELPVIVATGRTEPDDVVRALDLGANDHVAKPIDIEILHARIRAQLRDSLRAEPRPSQAPDAAAAPLDGKYEMLDKLGTGGFGSVYRARHRALDTMVAIKVLHSHLLDSRRCAALRDRRHLAFRVLIRMSSGGSTPDDRGSVPLPVMELSKAKSLPKKSLHRLECSVLPRRNSCHGVRGLEVRTKGASSTATSSPPNIMLVTSHAESLRCSTSVLRAAERSVRRCGDRGRSKSWAARQHGAGAVVPQPTCSAAATV